MNDIDMEYNLEEEEEKINRRNESIKNSKQEKNNSKYFSYLLLLMGMILLFIIMFSSLTCFSLIPFIHYILTIILLFISFNLTYREKEFGYYLSIIASLSIIAMISDGDYISSIIGIYIFISSFRFLIQK